MDKARPFPSLSLDLILCFSLYIFYSDLYIYVLLHPQEVIDKIPVIRFMRRLMKGAFRTNPAVGKVFFTKIATALTGLSLTWV